MITDNSTYATAANVADRFVEARGMRALFTALNNFGARCVGEVAEQNLPAFIAMIWLGPRLRRVK